MAHHAPSVRTLFEQALELNSAEELAAFLNRACAGQADLRAAVEALLQSHADAGEFLVAPAVVHQMAASLLPLVEQPGSVIGPYKLLQQIGEGGMGIVFMAEQSHPIHRIVALKVIKAGMDTRQVIARFEAERQALAMMDHPNVAKVLDAGRTESGRPYFVMELIKGVPITNYCDEKQLPVRERLELFARVCQAVQHAHQKGIIHRDIKPRNVLVAEYDDQVVPKVIDFGVAKAIAQKLTEKTMFTEYGQLIGTFEYMSPEQAKLNQLDVDTRSDIYSLGVLLYELLTDSTPLERHRLESLAFDETLRIIREEEPPKPSTRLSRSVESRRNASHSINAAGRGVEGSTSRLTSIATHRQTELARLTKEICGELDWVVMKCLEKDRNRRYQTANSLVTDLERYLANEAVEACPPSAWYRFRKFARRNRNAIVSVGVMSVGLLVAVVVLLVSNAQLRQAQAHTALQKLRAEKLQSLAEDRAGEIHQGLEDLKNANSALDRGERFSNLRRWDDGYAAFSHAICLRPDHVTAYVKRSDLLGLLGLFDLAAADFAHELRLREPESSARWYRHALLCVALGDRDTYSQLRQRMREQFQGTTVTDTAMDLVRTTVLTDDPNVDFEPAQHCVRLALAREHTSWYLMYLSGLAQYRSGNYESAVDELRASLTGSPPGPTRAMSYPILAMAHYRMGHMEEADHAFRLAATTIEQWRAERYQAPDPSGWIVSQGAVAHWPVTWWDWMECEIYFREADALIHEGTPRDDWRLHVLRARSLAGVGLSLDADEEYAAAIRLGPDDPQVQVEAYRNAGYSAVSRDQWSEAAAAFGRACHLSPDDTYLWRCWGLSHLGAGEVSEYQTVCHDMMDRFAANTDWQVSGNLVLTCVQRGDAIKDMSRLLPIAKRAEPWPHLGVYVWGASLYRAGRYEESIQCFEDAAKTFRPQAWDWAYLAMAHHHLHHTDEARRCLSEALHWINKINALSSDAASQGTTTGWGSWNERLTHPYLYHEAASLIEGNP